MRTLSDLTELIDFALKPGLYVAGAEARLGPIDRWIGGNAYVRDVDPALRESAIEGLAGEYRGIQTNLRPPLEVAWRELTEALGPAEELMEEVDNFSGRVTFRFMRLVGDRHGVVYLYAKRNEDPARIDSLTVRVDPAPR